MTKHEFKPETAALMAGLVGGIFAGAIDTVHWSKSAKPQNVSTTVAWKRANQTHAGTVTPGMVVTGNTTWPTTSPAFTADRVITFPDGMLQDPELRHLIVDWTSKDPGLAANWLNGSAPSPGRDAAVGAFVTVIARFEPSAAAGWASSIESEQERLLCLESTARAWMEIDQTVARSWVTNSDLPDEVKNRLLAWP